jgi:hypothetical protein
LAVAERPAHAAIDPVSIKAYVELATSVVKLVQSIFGGNGQDMAAQLRAIQDAVVGELRTLRNDQLQANTRSVFALFSDLADNGRTDPTNDEMWANIRILQQTTADAFYQVLQGSDVNSSYSLLPAYNSLLVTGTAVLALKKEIWSGAPSSWNDHYIWAQAGANADYRMVRSQRHQCYPGSNPGYKPPPPKTPRAPYAAWEAMTKPGKYKESVLWKKLANKSFHVETWSGQCCGGRAGCGTISVKTSCNAATRVCAPAVVSCSSFVPQTRTFAACGDGVSPADCAQQLAKPGFDDDAVVQVVRSGMKGVMTLSGGNDYDAASNNALLAQGKFVDPWTDESSCGSSAPWAYPQQP